MRKLLFVLLLSNCAYAQVPTKSVWKDSIPENRKRFVPDLNSSSIMPTVRPDNAFYRDPKDGPDVVRATLDNMPIKVPDSSMTYTMPGANRFPSGPVAPPTLKIFPHITPKKHE